MDQEALIEILLELVDLEHERDKETNKLKRKSLQTVKIQLYCPRRDVLLCQES